MKKTSLNNSDFTNPLDRAIGRGMSAFAGLLLAFAFPTEPDHPLAWMHNSMWGFVSLLPLFRCLPLPKWKDGFQIGWIMGSVFSLYSLYWVAYTQGGGLAVVGGTLLMAAYIGLFYGIAIGFLNIVVNRFASAGWFSAPFFWTGIEYLLSLGELGFPWLLLGITQAETIELIQYAEITGVYGVSFWVVLVNAVLWLSFTSVNLVKLSVGAFVLALLFALPWYYSFRVMDKTDPSETIRVGLVQNNIGLEKWQYGGLEQSFSSAESLSRKAAKQAPEIIVWPETAIPCRLRTQRDCRNRVENLARELGVTVLTGATDRDPQSREPYNTAFYIDPDRPLQSYAKMHLVPFGERTPFKDYISLFDNIDWTTLTGDLGPAEFARGDDITLFAHPKGAFTVLICFESVFPDFVRRSVDRGASFLIIITNDSWFGHTAGPFQHAQHSILRAVENRMAIARCATSGVSLFIDPYGRTSQATDIYTQAFVVGDIPTKNSGKTFYTRHGDLFAQLITGISFLLGLIAIRAQRVT